MISEISEENLDHLNPGIIKDIHKYYKLEKEGKMRLNAEIQDRFDRDTREIQETVKRQEKELKAKDERIKALEEKLKYFEEKEQN